MEPDQFMSLNGLQRFTENAKKVIVVAYGLAERLQNPEVLPVHIFIAILDSPSATVAKIFEKAGLDKESTKRELMSYAGTETAAVNFVPTFSEMVKEVINKSFLIAESLSHVYVGTEHLLLALLDMSDQQFVQELATLGLTVEAVGGIINSTGAYPPGVLSEASPLSDSELGERIDADALPFFCRDMNLQAARGEFLNITGRDEEIERMIHILARKTKNNPILVGDAGVGKTAVVQGLVQRIIRGQVPPSFIGKRVIALDVAAILAGARVRGDLEERILGFVNGVIESQDKIIFVDEVHMIVGAGGQGGRDAMDIGNIIKPYLTDSNLRLIGATTVSEYRRYFDDDAALSRRFQPVEINELDMESSTKILMALKSDFEGYHGVRIRDEAVLEAVKLSAKFIVDRYLPDKAIDLIDEAAASAKIGREIQIEPQLSFLGEKLMRAQHQKELALSNKDLGAASRFKLSEERIGGQIAELIEGGKRGKGRKVVDASMIRKIVVNWTKIPLAAGNIDNETLDKLEQRLGDRIVGQEQVLKSVTMALKRSYIGLLNSKRPLASFLFLGPTGVGKTELAKSIASELFGSSEMLYQINMSEFMEMHSVAKLIGSPPGYVGYQEGGQLTEHIRRRPYSVILFDEVEKAHPDVLNLLLQILEEGELTDGRGRKATFQNAVIVLTSNIGAEEVSKDKRLGFDVQVQEINDPELDRAFEEMRDSLLDTLKDEVRPELLNRLDEIAVFRGLNEQDCLRITELQLKHLAGQLLESGIELKYTPALAKHVNEQGYSKEYGARNIRRKIQELVENSLADFLLQNKYKNGMLAVDVKVMGGEVQFVMKRNISSKKKR